MVWGPALSSKRLNLYTSHAHTLFDCGQQYHIIKTKIHRKLETTYLIPEKILVDQNNIKMHHCSMSLTLFSVYWILCLEFHILGCSAGLLCNNYKTLGHMTNWQHCKKQSLITLTITSSINCLICKTSEMVKNHNFSTAQDANQPTVRQEKQSILTSEKLELSNGIKHYNQFTKVYIFCKSVCRSIQHQCIHRRAKTTFLVRKPIISSNDIILSSTL